MTSFRRGTLKDRAYLPPTRTRLGLGFTFPAYVYSLARRILSTEVSWNDRCCRMRSEKHDIHPSVTLWKNKYHLTPAQGILTNVPNSCSGRMAQIRGMQSAGMVSDPESDSHDTSFTLAPDGWRKSVGCRVMRTWMNMSLLLITLSCQWWCHERDGASG